MADEKLIAVFIDYENLALGVRYAKIDEFAVDLILKRLLEKGRIVYKRAYCDWSQYRNEVRDLHAHGVEMVDIPRSKMSGKNSADIHMVVDALDLSHAKQHIDIFALLTGDSDFSPLASKLKENNKRVIGCGVRSSTSNLLIGCCDEFIYYDDLVRAKEKSKPKAKPVKVKASASRGKGKPPSEEPEVLDQLVEIIRSLELDYDPLWGSMIKQTIRRVYPGFNEQNAGYKNFADLLKDAEARGYVNLDYDESRGNYIVHMRDE
ncbi:MAG: NYN domain-containing protein [bacterium]|nr:NYN domain-containing protein [bacterium]